MTVYKYTVEVEYRYSDNSSHPTPLLKAALNKSGIKYMKSVTKRRGRKNGETPVAAKDQGTKFPIVSAYYDGSVDSKVVFASNNGLGLSRLIMKLNKEIKFDWAACGQHISVMNVDKWFNSNTFYATQVISAAIEMGMLRKAGKALRLNVDGTRTGYSGNNINYAAFVTTWYRTERYGGNYPMVCQKTVEGKSFVEFRLHHPTGNPYFFFTYLPQIIKSLTREEFETLNFCQNPITSEESEAKVYDILERFDNWKYIKTYIKQP